MTPAKTAAAGEKNHRRNQIIARALAEKILRTPIPARIPDMHLWMVVENALERAINTAVGQGFSGKAQEMAFAKLAAVELRNRGIQLTLFEVPHAPGEHPS